MEIRRVLWGETACSSPRPVRAEKKTAGVSRPSGDRVELSRQWVQSMEEQRAQAQAALPGAKEKKSNGILDMLDSAEGSGDELEAEAEAVKAKLRCLKIAMNIMKGKRVPPEDERYLMENDPDGYKLAMALRQPPKKDEKECESVLDDEEQKDGENSEKAGEASGEAGTGASGGGEDASAAAETE